ncbi:glutathione S-transferase [Rhodotorula diobovata]|uniref:Glutathione S-transferase n=1 Tax=Rhodotorula diobovata TaxID=5288 RepID=A0A5C5G5B7_9BASI|nr:glutathione S-transferase [Rhodotorula diobovata]
MSSPQFTLYSHAGGPNGHTVAFLLKALDLSYETKYLDFAKGEQKSDAYLSRCANGRIPALVDHANGDFTVWESKACMLYLVAKYDNENKFGVGSSPEEQALLSQWLFFQASGQGPYFGQAAHFKMFAPEKIPYGIERYTKEVERVAGVLESVLSKQEWLVSNKLTIADLSFITWNNFGLYALLPEGVNAEEKFPALVAWHKKLLALPYVAEALKDREEAMKAK